MDDKEHHIKLTFDEGVYANLICEAPPESLCHASFACDCETYYDMGIDDEGVPYHIGVDDEDNEIKHEGTYKEYCNFKDWFEDEYIDASPTVVSLSFESEWQGEFFSFKVTGLK